MADGTYYVVTGIYWIFHFGLWLAYFLQLIIQRRAKLALRRAADGRTSAVPKRLGSVPSDIPEAHSKDSGSGANSNDNLVTVSPPQSVTTDRAYTIIGKTNLDASNQPSESISAPPAAPPRPQRFRSFDEPPDASAGNSTDALVPNAHSQDDVNAENEEKTTSGDGAVPEPPVGAKAKSPRGPKRSLSYRKRQPAPPRVGTLQKYLHPMGLFTQTVQLVQGIDPYSVFGVYDYRAPQLLFNTVNAMIIAMAAFTAYDFLRLRYNTILTDIPPWMKTVIISVVVFYFSEMFFTVFIRMDIGMKTWVNVINTFSMMFSELIIAVIFIANVVHLTKLIRALDQSFHRHRRPSTDNTGSKRLCCADPSGAALTPRDGKEPIPLADRQRSDVSAVSVQVKESNNEKPSEFRTIRVENSVSASISSTNRGKGTTFGRVVTNMRRFAWAAGIVTTLVVLSQLYLVSGKFGELDVTEKQNDPDDSSGFWRDSPMFALQWLIVFLGYFFTRLPIHYLWVRFHVKSSSQQAPSAKAARQRSAPIEPAV